MDNYKPNKKTHLIDVSQPFDDILEALLVRYVVDQHYAHSAAIVRRRDGVEALLAGGVPNL